VGELATIEYKYDSYHHNLTHVHKLVDRDGDSFEDQYETTEYVYEWSDDGIPATLEVGPGDHYITDIVDPRGLRPIRYKYDLEGRLIGVFDAKNNYIKLEHRLGDRAEVVTDRNGIMTFNYYDPRGNITAVTKGLGEGDQKIVTEYEYDYGADHPDKPIKVKVPLDDNPQGDGDYSITHYEYDSLGRTKKVTDPVGNVTHSLYEAIDHPDSVGNLIATWHKVPDPAYPEQDFFVVTVNEYDGNHRLIKTRVLKDRDDQENYAAGFESTITGVGAFYAEISSITEELEWTAYDYDTTNRIEKIRKVDPDDTSDPDGITVATNVYNPDPQTGSNSSDQPYSITDAAGSTRYFHYNENGSQDATWYFWDEPGSDLPGSNPVSYDRRVLTVSDYDDAGRVVRTRRITDDMTPDLGGYLAGDDGVVLSKTEYNSIGKPKVTIDQHGVTTKFEYDETGNLIETIVYRNYQDYETCYPSYNYPTDYPGVLTVSHTLYDKEGRTIVSVGPHDPYEPANGTETVYDVFGRVVETRRWKNVKIELQDLYNEKTEKIGRKIRDNYKPVNAWNGDGSEEIHIAWTSEGKRPAAMAESAYYASVHIAPLSYSRTIYDPAGRVRHAVTLDETGREQPTTYVYDNAGRQTQVIMPEGHKELAYSNPGASPRSIYDTDTYVAEAISIDFTSFGYNWENPDEPGGNLNGKFKTVTGYDGTRRDHVIDARAYDDQSPGENAYKTQFLYDAMGRLQVTIHPETMITNRITGVEAASNTYSYVLYDVLGRKWAQSGITDKDGQLTAEIDLRRFYYDAAGRLTKTILPDPDGVEPYDNPEYDYIYDEHGNQVAIIDPLNRMTVFIYNELNQLTEKYLPFKYEGATDVLSIYNAVSGSDGVETREYDILGRVVTSTDYKGQVTKLEYDALGRLEYKRYYENGTFYYETEPEKNATPEVYYEYDNLGRKKAVTITEYDSSGAPLPDTTRAYAYAYDAEGHIESVTGSDEGTVSYTYNTLTGQKIGTTTDNTETEYYYDLLNRLKQVSLVKRNGAGISAEATDYVYTTVGSRQSVQYPNDNFAEHKYNALNRLTELTNFDQEVGNVLSKFEYGHYADGMRSKAVETIKHPASGGTENYEIKYKYDYLNRIIEEDADGISGTDGGYSTEYTYDLAGNRLTRDAVIASSGARQYTEYDYGDYYDDLDNDRDLLLRETHRDTIPGAKILRPDGPYYAYATDGGLYYVAPGRKKIGQFKAFLLGLPSKWSQYLFYAATAMLALSFMAPALARKYAKIRKLESKGPRIRLSMYHRCLSALLAYLMLIGPAGFEQLAHGSTLYNDITTATWGGHGRIVEYGHWENPATGEPTDPDTGGDFIRGYDANGSVTEKLVWDISGTTLLEEVNYEYNLQNRLSKVTSTQYEQDYDENGAPFEDIETYMEYTYNDEGIRTAAYRRVTVDREGVVTVEKEDVTDYLVDMYNHTGYAQVLEEWTSGDTEPAVTYTIGDDVITQYKTPQAPPVPAEGLRCLLYDGHGSTRQLAAANGTTIDDAFSYDAYGVMLGGNPKPWKTPSSSLLYTGEQFDAGAQQYYLRARYYDPLNGRFNRMDPYAGSPQDPQSLHKYLYCHANPVNSVDPSGEWTVSQVVVGVGIGAIIGGISTAIYGIVMENPTVRDIGFGIALGGLALTGGGFLLGWGGAIAALGAEGIATTLGTSAASAVITFGGGFVADQASRTVHRNEYQKYINACIHDVDRARTVPREAMIVLRGGKDIPVAADIPDILLSQPEYQTGDKIIHYISEEGQNEVTLSIYEIRKDGTMKKKLRTTYDLPYNERDVFDDRLQGGWVVIENDY
jgi:RHS repeat-associated protein